MKVRQFSMKDYPAVKVLWIESGLEVRPGDSELQIKKKMARDADLFLVAEEDRKIVGTPWGRGTGGGDGFTT